MPRLPETGSLRKMSQARLHWIASGGFALSVLCCGLLFSSGCTSNPAPEEEAIAPAPGVEEAASAGEMPGTTMDANAEGAAGASSADRYADDSQSVSGKISDASLAAKVQLALMDTRDLRAHRFDPEAIAGHVVLRGHVDTWAQRGRAAEVAARVPGVVSVSNELTSTEEKPTSLAEASGLSGSTPGALSDDGNGSFGESASPGGGAEAPVYHTVMRGENLWTISRKYGVGVDRIRSLNGLRSDAIESGQRLRVR